MNVNDPADPLLPPPPSGHHRSARERQRKGPMFGCLKALFWLIAVGSVILLIGVGGGWWYVGSASFADYVRGKVEATLEARLGRDVSIERAEFIRERPQKVILHNVRIANEKGGVAPFFAVVQQVELTGGVQSFWGRRVSVDRVDIRNPQLWFEIFQDGRHNFPKWKIGPKRSYEIVHLEIGKLFVERGRFSFLDRKHDIEAVASEIASSVTVTRAEDLYEGIMTSPFLRVRIQDYEPIDVDLRGGFRYTPGILALKSIALKGRGVEAFLSGKLDPLTDGVYDLRLRSRLGLPRIKEIFRLEKTLEGEVVLDTSLKGKQGDFVLAGGWVSDRITADAYTLGDVRGTMRVTGDATTIDVERAGYGGGRIGAHYLLSKYAEPYPMKVDLRYDRISIEQLFNDWGVKDTGLRGAATGTLAYQWNKDRLLAGSGTGNAKLTKNATAFSKARYPIPIAGATDFALDNGVVRFRGGELDTDASHVSFTGTLRIEDLFTDLQLAIRSNDFSELDRIGYNFAKSADKKDYELLGLGGSGTLNGTVKRTIEKPQVVAEVHGSGIRYNNVLLGDGDIALRYDGVKSALTFDRAVFSDQGGRLALNGVLTFPDQGPSPTFDIAVEANGYPAQRVIDAVDLDLKIGAGIATGRLIVAGTGDAGRVTFVNLVVKRADADLKLNGDVQWASGEGNVRFDLDIAARDFPIDDVIAFLDLGSYPVTGKLTGALKLSGPKAALEGSGKIAVTEGSVFGEPVDMASADIVFEQGKMRAANVVVRAPAGEILGEAELDLATERFSYTIASSNIDLSKLKLLAGLKDLLGGNVTLRSTGAGSFDQPELVIEATLNEATLRGLRLPEGSAPPTLYLAIRNGKLVVRGAIADIVTIEGEGTLSKDTSENMAVDALVRVNVTDIAKLASISPKTATIPAAGNLVMVLQLSGHLSPIEALVIDATIPVFNLQMADHTFTAPEPLRVGLRNGRITFDSMKVQSNDAAFSVSGFADVTGDKTVNVDLRGRVEAALLQLFMTGVRADGHLDVAASVTGTMTSPRFAGTAELEHAQIKFAGFPQLISDINGVLRFRGDRIDIESVRATIGGGTVVLGGFLGLDGLKPTTARVTVQGTDVAIRYYEGLTIEGDFSLLLSGGLERATLQGDVNVTRALWFREFDLQQSLLNVILSRKGITPIASASWQDRLGLRIHLSAPETLAVRNNLADVTGSAELNVTGTVANPVVDGEITLNEGGTVRIQNVDYRVARGTIAFQNPFRIDPYFDVTLEGTVSGNVSEIESGPIEVTINLTGTLDRMTPTITSDPPASDITLFSILGFGGLTGAGGVTSGAGAGAYGQSLLYQSLFSALGQRVFPFVDSFAFDPGLLDAGGGAHKRATFEKRLSNRIRFLLVYNLDNQQSTQVVEWTVNRDWSLQLTRDETDEYRLDARFRRRYNARWSWGDRGRGELAMFGSLGAQGNVLQQPVAPPPPTTTVQLHAFDDATIAAVNFRADANVDTSTMGQYVTLRPGQPVTIRELQSSIKNLFSTGNFRDVRVDATRGDAGVTLTFALFLHYRVAKIEFEGIQRGDRTRAERALQFRTGAVLSLDAVDDSATEIQQVLSRGGYLEATVDPETTFDRARSLANVTFHITPGPRATIAEVLLEGELEPFTREELIKSMKREPGRSFDLNEAREDADRIKNLMIRRDYRQADVDFLGHTYDTERDAVTLRYSVHAGPKVRVEVTGVPRNAVRRLIPFRRNQEYSEDVVDRAADRIIEEYQKRGYYYASVDTEGRLDESANTWITTFHVSPGERYRLAEVAFSGNFKLREKELREVVATSPPGGIKGMLASLLRRPTGMTAGQLSDDRDAVESYYRLQGFSVAVVATPVVTTKSDGTMAVEFPVTEGPQTVIAAVTIEGNKQVAADDLPPLHLKVGDPLNPQLEREDTIALQAFYADRGNAEVQVKSTAKPSDDKTTATLTHEIAEGPRIKVDEVIVRGNTYTSSVVILRKSDLDRGDPFSYSSILEAQRQLYRLGIFQRVDIQPEQAGTTVGDRDVVITVEEGRNLTLTGSVGLRAERGRGTKDAINDPDEPEEENKSKAIEPRVAIAAAHRNLFGTGRYAGIEAIFSSKEREFFITYREPFLSRWDVPVQVQLYQTDDSTRPGTTIQQQGTSIEATKIALSRTRWSLRYDYRISKCVSGLICAAVNEGDPVEGLDRSLLNIDISSVSPTFFWDHRDDIIDPHKGFFTSASVEFAFPFLSAKANFLKEFVQGAYYLPVSARTVVALSGRVGLIQPLGSTSVDDVPIVERFTAGGETSHRAFPLDLMGNLCQDDADFDKDGNCDMTLYQAFNFTKGMYEGPILPIGGSSLLLFNAEYRFPVFGPVGAAVFVDAGTISRESTIRFDRLRYGAGFGIRYLSPVGPLRIDIGLPFEKRSYEKSWQYFITLGYAF